METPNFPILPDSPDVLAVAARVVWFEPPEHAIRNVPHLLVHLMTYGTIEDLAIMRLYVRLEHFRRALAQASPGIMDARSWAYWHLVCGRREPPPLPVRQLPPMLDV